MLFLSPPHPRCSPISLPTQIYALSSSTFSLSVFLVFLSFSPSPYISISRWKQKRKSKQINPSKTKKKCWNKSSPTKQKQTEEHGFFCVGQLLLGWRPVLDVVFIPRLHWKSWFSLERRYQMQKAFVSEWDSMTTSHSQCCDFVLFKAVKILCVTASTPNTWPLTMASYSLLDICFLSHW